MTPEKEKLLNVILSLFGDKEITQKKIPIEINKCYFFRNVTYHLVGKVVAINENWVTLEDASWIADSGRFMNAIKEGALNEVEPVGIAYINTEATSDIFPWIHALPIKQK